ncbi:MAG: DUF2269 domain-containing protein [Leptospiraceae bacterium]|nr:DUF2269 family protein [Leptospiraceae bacterium]MCK6381075.1 DUF2269 domain-containing protein [Leptospiraceae bacterium]NUM42302.1 DUF2269 family protein [Leptospiraceae bacterium]
MKRESIISLVNGFVLMIFLVGFYFHVFSIHFVFSYSWHKVLHILGVVLFFGNMVVGPVWVSYAFFSQDEKILDFSLKVLRKTDISLTIFGLDLLVINGLILSSAFGDWKNQEWIFYSVILLAFMWVLSLPVVYIQEKLFEAFEREGSRSIEFLKYLKLWAVFGTITTIPPSIIFYLMIAKNI